MIRPDFLSNLKLSQKGLLLVGLLLSLELLFVGSLSWLLYESERESAREAHSKAILGKTQRLMELLYETADSLKAYGRTQDPIIGIQYEKNTRDVQQTLTWLKTALQDNKEDRELLQRMEENTQTGLAIFNEAREKVDGLNPPLAKEVVSYAKAQVAPIFKQMVPDWLTLVRSQKRITLESPEAQQKARRTVQIIVIIGFFLNVFLAVLLGLFFAQSITARLNILVDNTIRLKTRQSLNPRLHGNDEIVYLDHAFHQMAEDLHEVQKLRQAFVAMVSHELRTPLTSVRAFLELLGMGAMGEVSTQAKDDAKAAEQNVVRLIKLINELLDLEKLEVTGLTVEPTPLSLNSVFQSSYEAVKDFAQVRKVTLEVTPTNLIVLADHDRIVQVMVNLLSNAIKYSPDYETVTVTVEACTIGAIAMAEIRIRDHGKGIPAKYQEVIFERFQQVEPGDSKMGGTGLGLAITKAIVEKHGGTIGVKSEEGKGSTFWFRLLIA